MITTKLLSVLGYVFDGTFGNVTLRSTDAGYVRIAPSSAPGSGGGPIQLLSGDGQGPGNANPGGDIILQGGAGGNGGRGANVNIYGGSGSTDDNGEDGNGGDIKLSPGTGSGGTSRNGLLILDPAMIPTADPEVNGAVWNDAGVLKVSAG